MNPRFVIIDKPQSWSAPFCYNESKVQSSQCQIAQRPSGEYFFPAKRLVYVAAKRHATSCLVLTQLPM